MMKNRIIKIISVLIFSYFLSYTLFLVKSGEDKSYIVGDSRPLIIAHGGSKDLFPENTMIAFDGSDSIGVDMLEMDVLLTKDTVLVCHHNETINNSTESKGFVKDYTFEELTHFNFGYNFRDTSGNYSYRDRHVLITSLEETLIKYGKKYPMCIELKNKDSEWGKIAADKLYSILKRYDMKDRVIISCFDDDILKYFKQISGKKIRTATARKETKKIVTLSKLYLSQFYSGNDDVMQIPVENSGHRLDTKSVIKAAHRKNIAVHYWTIDNPEEMKRLIQLGADGIITDRPDIMRKVLKEMGY
jgi:glycerophosphoryl diester phosphodiesterase